MPELLSIIPITAWTTVILSTWLIVLAYRVVTARRANKIAFGDGDDRAMTKRIRGHANAAEQIPISLILLALCEGGGAPTVWVMALASTLIIGRFVHGLYFSWQGLSFRMRTIGMILTVLMQGLAIITLAWLLVAQP